MGKLLLLCETIIRSLLRCVAVFPINGRMRDEFLNGEIFYSFRQAQITIEGWKLDYETKRPHSALGYRRPPAPDAVVPMDQRPTMH